MTRAQIEQAAGLGMVKEPQVDRHHVVDEDEIAFLLASAIARVLAEQAHTPVLGELVELVKGDAGHAALVLLARAIDIEVAKPDDLRARVLEALADQAAQALVQQQLAVTIDVERALVLGVLDKGVGASVGGCR